MPQTEADRLRPLDYADAKRASNDWAAWTLAVTLGSISGDLISDAGFGVGGIAILSGIVTGTACAFAAERRQFLPALVGDGIATIVGLVIAGIKYPRVGTTSVLEQCGVAFALYLFLAIPTVLCAGMLWLARRVAQRAAA